MDGLRVKWPVLLVGAMIAVGFAGLLWQRWRQQGRAGWSRSAVFFTDLIALAITLLFVGVVAASQLPSIATPTPTTTATSARSPLPTFPPTASPTVTPTPTPSPSPTPEVTNTPTTSPTPATLIHVVQEGEVLLEIANQYGVTVEAIREANSLANDFLRVGQELLIPLPTPTPEATTPLPAETPQAAPTPTPEPTATSAVIIHVVQQGEILGTIARRYGVTVDDILALNPGLDPRRLRIGQEIKVPAR
ncbi:MAG: LysM peptidoglycan-binding domain-containing protein [Ardenticatenia bacterium]|nr:LysM peptidoglycan-binding domain-containing protein [Ardenticatenia bacterium]